MSGVKILLIFNDRVSALQLEQVILKPQGYEVLVEPAFERALYLIENHPLDLVVIEDHLLESDKEDRIAQLIRKQPGLTVLLFTNSGKDQLALKAIRAGVTDLLFPPLASPETSLTIEKALQRKKDLEKWVRSIANRDTRSLQKRVSDLETLQKIGRRITASLNLDSVLAAVVDAAVELTGAEEGSLLLLDEDSSELSMRAARNFREDFVRTFRIPVKDSLIGEVLRAGQPLMINEKTPQKIKTSFLVRSLVYIPLLMDGKAIGVLGVDNRESSHTFSEYELTLLTSLADYATIAIKNARFYTESENERHKWEHILTNVKDGIIVLDTDKRLMLINQTARQIFNLGSTDLAALPDGQVIQNPDLLEILDSTSKPNQKGYEIKLEDGRVFNTQVTSIPEVGLAITMQDITHLKELDRIKSDFVSTVSHDLRSPLTAILGYTELIKRIGPLNPKQKDFIERVQNSVQSITALINDLLDLGKIEAGIDAYKENISISTIAHATIETFENTMTDKSLTLTLDIPAMLPPVYGNPIRLRQMLANLISNAINYTPKSGAIKVCARAENDQIILQISDNGPGISPTDQPYIFDKFYRGSNLPPEVAGTGLGLAIVKSIVEDHHGRIWVDSTPGKGSTFTVILPIAQGTNMNESPLKSLPPGL